MNNLLNKAMLENLAGELSFYFIEDNNTRCFGIGNNKMEKTSVQATLIEGKNNFVCSLTIYGDEARKTEIAQRIVNEIKFDHPNAILLRGEKIINKKELISSYSWFESPKMIEQLRLVEEDSSKT